MSTSHYKPTEDLKKQLTNKVQDADKIIIKPKALAVTWGRDSRYWEINEKENQEGPITLNQVSWLEVTGSFPTEGLSNGTYNITFKVSLKANAFGWQGSPVYFCVINPKTKKRTWRRRDLSGLKKGGKEENVPADLNVEFTRDADATAKSPEINFGLYEIWRGGWKGGLEIQEVVIQKINT